MKTGIHPELKDTKVTCNGCGNAFDTRSTVDKIEVEICSNCHPFYTGKQKLVDTAGRVDRFRAKQEAAKAVGKPTKAKKERAKTETTDVKADLKAVKAELAGHTVDKPVKDTDKAES